jgi:type I restriction-modification system DNA methylase subunit
VPSSFRPGPLSPSLTSSARAEAEVTRELYAEYKGLRERLFAQIRKTHSSLPAQQVLGHAQTILDRVLFIAFAEGRDLLPENTLADVIAGRHTHATQPIWDRLKALFRWIDRGNPDEKIPAYGGGLFRCAEPIDRLEVSDEVCKALGSLARHDFRNDVSIDVLGHIFEQSIRDLEASRRGVEGAEPEAPAPSIRHDEGIYYTPAHLARYLVERTLGRTLAERRQAIFDRIEPEARKTKEEQIAASIEAWEAYRDAVQQVRVLDPACGAGAFLIASHDALGREYRRALGELADLRGGQVELFDLERALLDDNLFGVDRSRESVEIAKLSLWLEAARHGRRLTHLDGNITCGDSLVGDPRRSAAAFDVVIGNPPYIRHELFTHRKGHLDGYAVHHGMADAYVYFFERALSVLKPHGRLGFIVSNKWLRAGYAAPLRALLAQRTEIESLVDFGHAPIFGDADAFPCIITLRKLAEEECPSPEHRLAATTFPRSEISKIEIAEYVASHHHAVPQKRLGEEAWSLEPEAVEALYQKIRARGAPLSQLPGGKPHRGFLTGYNEAFVVDDPTRRQLIGDDPRSAEIIKKCLRGQDVDRWSPGWGGTFLLCARHGIDIDAYPAVKHHLSKFRRGLEPRPRDHQGHDWPGRKPGPYKWYELQDAIDYWDSFARPKIVYQEIQFHPSYGLDTDGLLVNNKTFFLCNDDPWLLAVLNSPLMWWHNWRYLGHMKDEALSPAGAKMEQLPIAPPDEEARAVAEDHVPQLVAFVKEDHEVRSTVLEALRTQMKVEAPGQKLEAFEALSRDELVVEVTKRRPKGAGKLKPTDLKYLGAIYDEYAAPIQDRRRRALAMERRLADLVHRAYGLTPDEVELLWATAPPRMPVGR